MQTCTSAMDRFHVTKSTSAAKKAISMRLKTFVNLVLVTIVVTPTALFSQTSIANSPLAITAKAIDSPEPALEFSVTNVSSTAVSIYLAELPWSGEMVLVAKPDDAPPLIRLPFPKGIARPDARTLDPGEMLSGRLRLSPEFENLKEAFEKGRVIIFWYYQVDAVAGRSLGQYGGWAAFGVDSEPPGH
jgi:hypothetical protein